MARLQGCLRAIFVNVELDNCRYVRYTNVGLEITLQEPVMFFTILFCLMVAFYAVKSYKEGNVIHWRNMDMINMGYIEPNNVVVNVQQQNSKKETLQSQQLYLDCISALYTLGMKKSQAKKKAQEIFAIHNPETVQEFLVLALQK